MYALQGKGLNETHIQNCSRKLKNGYFTRFREKEYLINERLSDYRMKEIYQNLLKTIISQRTSGTKIERFVY